MTSRERPKSSGQLARQLDTFERLAGFRPVADVASVQGITTTGPERPRLMNEYARVLHHARMHPGEALPAERLTAIQQLRAVTSLGERVAERLQSSTLVTEGQKPRALQVTALDALSRFCNSALGETPGADGLLRTHFAVATGIGKTGLICMIANAAEMPTLALVPFKTLVRQTVRDAEKFVPGLKVGVYYGDEKRIPENCGLIVATYDSAAKLLATLPPDMKIPLVFYDEAHMALTEHRLGLIKSVPGAALVIGCTGSPIVNELKQVGNHFGRPLVEISTAQGIRLGQLSTTYAVILKTNIPVKDTYVNTDGEIELTPEQREKLVAKETRNQAVISLLDTPEIKGRGTIVTCIDTAHAEILAKKAIEAGHGPVGVLHYKADTDEEQVLADCRAGKIKTLFVVRKTVGVDLPNFEVLINARPTWSLTDGTQRTGRVVRLCDQIPDKVALVIDLLDDYTLTEQPITGVAILEGAVVLPEGAESRPGTRQRIEKIQNMALSAKLPDGFKLLLTQQEQLEIISGDKDSATTTSTRGLQSLEDVREVLGSIGISSADDFYTLGASKLLKSRVESEDPPFSGSLRSLISGAVQHICKRPDLAFRQTNYRVLLDALYGDEAWQALRKHAPEATSGGLMARLIEKLASVPLAAASSRVKVNGITRSPELDGWEQLRFLGIPQNEVEALDLSAVIPPKTLERLIALHQTEIGERGAELLASRDVSALVQDLRRIGTLRSILTDTPPGLERLTFRQFRERQYTDPESGQTFMGSDVARTFGFRDGYTYDEFVKSVVLDPARVGLGKRFRGLSEGMQESTQRTIDALAILAADGQLLPRLRSLELTPEMSTFDLSTRFLRDPIDAPIPAMQVIDCLVGPGTAGDARARLQLLTKTLSTHAANPRVLEVQLLKNIISWGERFLPFYDSANTEINGTPKIITPKEALARLTSLHHHSSVRGLVRGQREWRDELRHLAIVKAWQKQNSNFLTREDRQQLARVAEGIVPFNAGYHEGWWRFAAEIGELIERPVRRTPCTVGSVACEIREQISSAPTFDLLAVSKETPTLFGRVTVLGEAGDRPWILVERTYRDSNEHVTSLPPDLVAKALPNILKVAFPERAVSPVVITRQSGGPVHQALRSMPDLTIIPMTGTRQALATEAAHVEGPLPSIVPNLPDPYTEVAKDALRGAAVREQFVTTVESYLKRSIPEDLATLIRDEVAGFNGCVDGAADYATRIGTAMNQGTNADVIAELGTSPRQLTIRSSLSLAVDELRTNYPKTLPSLTDAQVNAVAALAHARDRTHSDRRTNQRDFLQAVRTSLGLETASTSSASPSITPTPSAPEPTPTPVTSSELALTPSHQLPKTGPLFNPNGKLLLFVSSIASGPSVHANPACASITDAARATLVAQRADQTLPKPRSTCCSKCGTPEQDKHIAGIERTWAKAIPQRVVAEGPWGPGR